MYALIIRVLDATEKNIAIRYFVLELWYYFLGLHPLGMIR
jgi:hypothetical protein